MSLSTSNARTFLAMGLFAIPAFGQESKSPGYEAACDSLSGNARSDETETICVGVKISDGINEISAGLAATNKFDFDGSLWRLSDDVRLGFETTEILADDALFEFEADELVLGELTGTPVMMSDVIAEDNKAVSGTAQSISYNSRTSTLRLIGQATLVIGENEFIGCDWIYNFSDKSYQAGTSDDCEGVTIVLAPPEESEDPAGQTETP